MQAITLLSRHAKQMALTKPLAQAGYALHCYTDFDTDQLGTFCGQIPRRQHQIETAIHKAQLAAKLGGTRFGLGSEGAFGPDPFIGLSAWSHELLAWWDAAQQYAVLAHSATPDTNFAHVLVHGWDAARDFAPGAGFPTHALMVGTPARQILAKGLNESDALRAQVEALLAEHGAAWLETDMRAHLNPTRMAVIGQTGLKLAAKLNSHCPACARPGYAAHRPLAGAPCRQCGTATRRAKAEIWQCPACQHEATLALASQAEPAECDACNA